MSQELFYTSAPKGLRPGSRGFCTVAATRGLSAALMEKLESLSGYRPLFPPHDARAGLNPVALAHVRISAGGRTYTVVSRIGPAGLDYTERPNKFAHHVVLDAAELPAGGPAWLLRQPGFLESRWDGQVQVLSAGRLPPRGDAAPDVCRNWQTLTGDAGWAGVLAEAFQADPTRLVYLIFEPGMDVLPLLAESLALLPPEQRWEVTFSTYFTGLPQGAQCLWRCVPRGSPEAKGARQFPNALILDVGDELGAARGGALVARARGQAFVPPPVPGKGADWQEQFKEDRIGEGIYPFDDLNTGRPSQLSSGSIPVHENPGLTIPPPPPVRPPEMRKWRTGRKTLLLGVGGGVVGGMVFSLVLMVSYLFLSGNERVFGFRNSNDDQDVKAELVKEKKPADLGKEKGDKAGVKEPTKLLDESRKNQEELAKELTASKQEAGRLAGELGGNKKKMEEMSRKIDDLQKKIGILNKRIAELQKRKPEHSDKINGSAKIDLVSYNLSLPTVGPPGTGLPIREVSPEESKSYRLRLRGLEPEIDEDYELTAPKDGANTDLTIRLSAKKKKPVPFAHFWLDGRRLNFEWMKTDVKQHVVDIARRKIRNSVLEIISPDPAPKRIHVGLILSHRNSETPWNFRFSHDNPTVEHPIVFGKIETKPLHPLFIYSAKGDMKSGPTEITAGKNQVRLLWKENIALKVEKKIDEENLVGEWKGKESPPPNLNVSYFRVYMEVDGLNVEVLRVGKE